MIPKFLYRGDSDPNNVRWLKKSIDEGMLLTNLISGGNPQEIASKPLIELVKIHIKNEWGKTHFLSFTEEENSAIRFGSFGHKGEPNIYVDDTNDWDFALVKFRTNNLKEVSPIEKGVYECDYTASLREFRNGCKLLLINTVDYLRTNLNSNTASQLKSAERDKEWLILPTNSKLFNNGKVEYSAKIDMADVFDHEKYVMIE
jgi:hypothetical protein